MERKDIGADQLYGPAVGPSIDGTPMSIPAGFKKPETMEERLKRFIRRELSESMREQGVETFDEANDFDLPDDPVDPSTPFEEFFDPVLGREITPQELQKFEAQYRAKYLEAQAEAQAREDREEAFRLAIKNAREARKSGGGAPHQKGAPPPDEDPKTP